MSARSLRQKKRQFSLKASSDFYEYLWFCYHCKFYGALTIHGRKATAFRFFLAIKESLKAREFFDVYYTFLVAMLQITPSVLIVQSRLGASHQGVPFPLSARKKITFAVKWVIKFLKDKNGQLSAKAVVDLLFNSLYNKGEAIERKRASQRTALDNRFLIQRFFR